MDFRATMPFLSVLFCTILSSSAKDVSEKQPAALVVGTVLCDTCFQQAPSVSIHFIPGASVAVECGDAAANKPSYYRTVVATNHRGVFRARLPPKISKHAHLIESCAVTLVKSNEPFCAVASSATTPGLRLKSRRRGVHVYSAGFFSFKPLNQPDLCYQKPALFRDQKQEQQPGGLFVPLPTVTILPSPTSISGGVQLPTNPLFNPPVNPFQPPPSSSVLPTFPLRPPMPSFNLPPVNPLFNPPVNPFQPPPSSSVLPTFPLRPPTPSFNLPPVTSLGAPPPLGVLPFPQTPFFPFPRIPGIPSAASSKKASP